MNNIIYAVCMLFQISNNNVIGTATGFFFQNNSSLYLITNRHVVQFSVNDLHAKLILNIHVDSSNHSKFKQIEIPLNHTGKLLWYGYSDPTIDVVAIPIDKNLISGGIVTPLSKENFPPSDISLTIGDDLLAIGYPRGFTDQINLTPIAKSCIISTPIEIPFENKPMILIDGNLQPGMSGSPIITKPSSTFNTTNGIAFNTSPSFFLVGIHSATFYKNIDIKKEPIYVIKEGQITISGFKIEPIQENLGLQTCWFNGVIQNLVEQIK